mmetsp:Transcript_60058/g.131588  ORF Transcript_60058/g.131588 Transcript_60058/m.131588 type:complete len:134 (+) Transcript_60058:675-1076(+)
MSCTAVGVEGSNVSMRLVVELLRFRSDAALTISVQVKLAPNSKHKRRKAQSVTCSMGANTTRPRSFQPPSCHASFKMDIVELIEFERTRVEDFSDLSRFRKAQRAQRLRAQNQETRDTRDTRDVDGDAWDPGL